MPSTTMAKPRGRYNLPTVLCCALTMLGFLVCASSSSRAEPSRDVLLSQEPLAESKVRLKEPVEEPERMQPNLIGIRRSDPADQLLAVYARGHDGQWVIPTEVDRDDPWIRILVLGPTKPLVIDLAVFVEDKTFRDVREQWIDSLVAKATASPEDVNDATKEDEAQEESAEQEETVEQEPAPEEVAEEENAAEEDSEEETEVKSEEDAVPAVQVQRRRAPTAVDRLRQYLAAGVDATDREEIRWLVAEWAGGPGLLTFGTATSWQRAEVAPLWSWLDSNHDRVLSEDEIKVAAGKLQQADTDQNDVVDLDELQQTETSYTPYARKMSHPLVVFLNKQTAWRVLRREIVNHYGVHADGKPAGNSLKERIAAGDPTLTKRNLEGLLSEPADIVCRFDLTDKGGKVALLGENDGDASQGIWSSDEIITVDTAGGSYVEFSALSMASGKQIETNQLTVSGVVDGYPLFRLLDQDDNRRLTLRECRSLGECLAGLDLNADGKITEAEIPTAIRLAVTRGLLAQEILRQPIAASKKISAQEQVSIPSWFVDMDRNSDGDLSRREFLGTLKQFEQLDKDADGLINSKEAQESSKQNE